MNRREFLAGAAAAAVMPATPEILVEPMKPRWAEILGAVEVEKLGRQYAWFVSTTPRPGMRSLASALELTPDDVGHEITVEITYQGDDDNPST